MKIDVSNGRRRNNLASMLGRVVGMEDRCIEWGENNGTSRQRSVEWWGWKIDVSNGEKTMDPRVNARECGGDGRSMYRIGRKQWESGWIYSERRAMS